MHKYEFRELYDKIKNPKTKEKFIEYAVEEIFNNTNFKGYSCPVCGERFPMFLPYSNRKKVACPNCNSFERQRFISYYLREYTQIFSKPIKLLHFAPELGVYNLFNTSYNIDYLPVDIEMKALVKQRVDMCNMPFEDNSFDVIYNCHVLEHVENDIKAMNELYRCVKPSSEGGFIIIMVPLYRKMEVTLEKKEYNTPELRLKYYHQEDHLRKYGRDFKERLENIGFEVDELICSDFVADNLIEEYGLMKSETLFICKKSD